jgi:hypothetical protein
MYILYNAGQNEHCFCNKNALGKYFAKDFQCNFISFPPMAGIVLHLPHNTICHNDLKKQFRAVRDFGFKLNSI